MVIPSPGCTHRFSIPFRQLQIQLIPYNFSTFTHFHTIDFNIIEFITYNKLNSIAYNTFKLPISNQISTLYFINRSSTIKIKHQYRVNARNTCTILWHTLRVDLFFGHNFCILSPNDSKFIRKVLMTITHLA